MTDTHSTPPAGEHDAGFAVKITAPIDTPRGRVVALEGVTQVIAEEAGVDPADGTMMLLTAAVHLAMRYSGKRSGEVIETLAYSLGCASRAAEEFFPEVTVQ